MEIPATSEPLFSSPEAQKQASGKTLTVTERVAYQRAIEEVYWRHRIWPKVNAQPKPSLDAVISQALLERKSLDRSPYLQLSYEKEVHFTLCIL